MENTRQDLFLAHRFWLNQSKSVLGWISRGAAQVKRGDFDRLAPWMAQTACPILEALLVSVGRTMPELQDRPASAFAVDASGRYPAVGRGDGAWWVDLDAPQKLQGHLLLCAMEELGWLVDEVLGLGDFDLDGFADSLFLELVGEVDPERVTEATAAYRGGC